MLLRPHLKTCLSCRARLKEFRAAPSRVAALVPSAVLAAGDTGGLRSVAESALAGIQVGVEGVLGATQQKAAALGVHAAAELAAAQKVAAVAASAAALAGGGTAVDQFANHHGPPRQAPVERVRAKPVEEELRARPTARAPQPVARQQPAATDQVPAPATEQAPSLPAPPDPAREFTPGTDLSTASAAPAPV